MQWMVYKEDFNLRKIKKANILKGCEDEIKRWKKQSKGYEDFNLLLHKEMVWRYWSRCECEVLMCRAGGKIILKSWVNPKNENICLDVTDDKDFNWKGFADECSKRYVSTDNEIKIDIYDQLRYRWDDFCRYCWNMGVSNNDRSF